MVAWMLRPVGVCRTTGTFRAAIPCSLNQKQPTSFLDAFIGRTHNSEVFFTCWLLIEFEEYGTFHLFTLPFSFLSAQHENRDQRRKKGGRSRETRHQVLIYSATPQLVKIPIKIDVKKNFPTSESNIMGLKSGRRNSFDFRHATNMI